MTTNTLSRIHVSSLRPLSLKPRTEEQTHRAFRAGKYFDFYLVGATFAPFHECDTQSAFVDISNLKILGILVVMFLRL